MSRFNEEAQNFEGRLSAIQIIALAVFLMLGVRFWVLQVVNHEAYAKAAENNRIRDIPIPAPRGSILDRHGRILVDSRPAFTLSVNREDLQRERLDATLRALEVNLGVDPEYAKERINDPSVPKSRPVYLKSNLEEADRAWVESHELEYPELHVEPTPQRIYPLKEKLAHVLGYVGEISERQLEANLPEFAGAKSGDVVGQSGIERSHNQILMGREGKRSVVVDSGGRFVEEIERVEPVPGQDLTTTIDLDVQTVAEQQLAATGLNGTAVALDPRNGEVLAIASHPSYNPNLFSGGISAQDYAKLRDNPDRPLRNRAVQDIYPPGSTWKTIMAMAGLSEGAMKPEEAIACGGGIQVGNKFTACHGSHGAPDVERALAVSCNGYFYRVGLRLGVDKINRWATAMGFGKPTGIDLPNEQPGYIPERNIKLRFKKKDSPADLPIYQWKDIDTVHASIGQGYDRPTPLQMVHAFSGIAMNGRFTTPHLLKQAAASAVKEEVVYKDEHVIELPLVPSAYKHVMAGMRQVVTNGTARRAEVPGFEVGGKTGTAQIVSVRTGATGKQKEHAWFVGFAPVSAPEIAVAIIVENGGHGGVTCAPIAQAIFTEYVRVTRGVVPEAGAVLAGGSPLGPDSSAIEPADEAGAADVLPPVTQNDTTVGDDPAPTVVPKADSAAPEPGELTAAGEPAEPLAPQINPLQGLLKSDTPQSRPVAKRPIKSTETGAPPARAPAPASRGR